MNRDTQQTHGDCSCTLDGIEADVIAAFDPDESFVRTPELVERLIERRPSRWSADSCSGKALTPQRLGRYLSREMGVFAKQRPNHDRGYCREDFGHATGACDV